MISATCTILARLQSGMIDVNKQISMPSANLCANSGLHLSVVQLGSITLQIKQFNCLQSTGHSEYPNTNHEIVGSGQLCSKTLTLHCEINVSANVSCQDRTQAHRIIARRGCLISLCQFNLYRIVLRTLKWFSAKFISVSQKASTILIYIWFRWAFDLNVWIYGTLFRAITKAWSMKMTQPKCQAFQSDRSYFYRSEG